MRFVYRTRRIAALGVIALALAMTTANVSSSEGQVYTIDPALRSSFMSQVGTLLDIPEGLRDEILISAEEHEHLYTLDTADGDLPYWKSVRVSVLLDEDGHMLTHDQALSPEVDVSRQFRVRDNPCDPLVSKYLVEENGFAATELIFQLHQSTDDESIEVHAHVRDVATGQLMQGDRTTRNERTASARADALVEVWEFSDFVDAQALPPRDTPASRSRDIEVSGSDDCSIRLRLGEGAEEVIVTYSTKEDFSHYHIAAADGAELYIAQNNVAVYAPGGMGWVDMNSIMRGSSLGWADIQDQGMAPDMGGIDDLPIDITPNAQMEELMPRMPWWLASHLGWNQLWQAGLLDDEGGQALATVSCPHGGSDCVEIEINQGTLTYDNRRRLVAIGLAEENMELTFEYGGPEWVSRRPPGW
ncbi:MAG: hypothetical protein ACXIUB_03975 [Wenzhouxiangella sp.]